MPRRNEKGRKVHRGPSGGRWLRDHFGVTSRREKHRKLRELRRRNELDRQAA